MTEPATILLTTPDDALCDALRAALPGVSIRDVRDGPPRERIEGRAWCFVDWLLDDISGLELCRRLRDAPITSASHITMVLDEDDPEARRRALRAGADDYMPGPLTPATLVARMRLYLASGGRVADSRTRLAHGDLVVDTAARQVRWRGRVIPLRPNEFELLVHFLSHPDRVFSRTALIARLGKNDAALDERTVDVWVGRLRRALRQGGAPDPLRTVRAMGYVLDGYQPEAWRAAG